MTAMTSDLTHNLVGLDGESQEGDGGGAGGRGGGAARVAVTSFNEWHEGTQIEPAAAAFTPDRPGVTTYLAYPSPEFYLTKTAAWVETFVAARRRAGVG